VTNLVPAEAPSWEYLVSHHQPSRFNRTIRIRIAGRTLHFCARCTGQAIGAVACLVVLVTADGFRAQFFSIPVQLVVAAFPAFPAWDWIAQTVSKRESNNLLRIVTGSLLGFALVDGLAAILTAHWTIAIGATIIFVAYVVILMVALRLSGAWREVIEEHFPGVELQTVG
jgi:uncharacterized membrane protein